MGRGGWKGPSSQSTFDGPGVTWNIPVSPKTLVRGSSMISPPWFARWGGLCLR